MDVDRAVVVWQQEVDVVHEEPALVHQKATESEKGRNSHL